MTPTPEALAQVARIRAQHSEGHRTTLPHGPHPECDVCDLLSALAEQAREIEAYRGALGYPVRGDHNGRLNDGTYPVNGIAEAKDKALARLQPKSKPMALLLQPLWQLPRTSNKSSGDS